MIMIPIFDAVRERGYDEAALNKLAHRNWLRVLRKLWRDQRPQAASSAAHGLEFVYEHHETVPE